MLGHVSALVRLPAERLPFFTGRKRCSSEGALLRSVNCSDFKIAHFSRSKIPDTAATIPGWSRQYATLRILGPDQPGIVAAVSGILDREKCAILKSEQFTDLSSAPSDVRSSPFFFQRIVFETSAQSRQRQLSTHAAAQNIHIPFTQGQKIYIQDQLKQMVSSFQLDLATINWRERVPRVAIMVSAKHEHCLWELLLRHKQGELACEISTIISNHPTLEPIAQTFAVPFHHCPIPPGLAAKEKQEQQVLALLQNTYRVDTLILARYMQILSKEFISAFDQQISQTHFVISGINQNDTFMNRPPQIINIHHSFLPAFIGAHPYHSAHARGVKLIGATAHYVTEDLDAGPIIEQDVIRVTHRDPPEDLMRKGRIIEKNVLVAALQAHLSDRVLTHNNKCVLFGD